MTRVLSGIQPTGDIHLGNYVGAIRNWVADQYRYDALYCVVDLHALTVPRSPDQLREKTLETAMVLLAAGLDPDVCTLFVQSHVPEHTELCWLLMCVASMGELRRMTQFKDKAAKQETVWSGLLLYPVLQAADILVYKADTVPVGEDQVQHIELTREIARRFNHLYEQVFPEPKTLKSPTPKIPGLDARKMSKSYGNTIDLGDRGEALKQKVMAMFTDPKKIRKDDPGNPDGCVVYAFHAVYTKEDAPQIEQDCRAGKIGCVACKKNLLDHMAPALEPLWTRRDALKKEDVDGLLEEGCQKARIEAEKTLHLVRRAMKLP